MSKAVNLVKSCHFCSSDKISIRRIIIQFKRYWFVECGDCKVGTDHYWTEEKAVDCWNKGIFNGTYLK